MADLISRAAAIDAIVSLTAFQDAEHIKSICQNQADIEDWLGGVCDAINAVEGVNTVDAAPVRHGRWLRMDEAPEWDQRRCSECGDISCCQRNYCPNCGAKMEN